MNQLQLAAGERQHPADVVGDAEGQEGDDHQQQQDPPEAQVLHKLLPGGAEAGQDALAALQVGVEQRVALHRAGTQKRHADERTTNTQTALLELLPLVVIAANVTRFFLGSELQFFPPSCYGVPVTEKRHLTYVACSVPQNKEGS